MPTSDPSPTKVDPASALHAVTTSSQAYAKRVATGMDLTAPISTALTGGVDVFGIMDPGVGVEKSQVTEECVSFEAPGEMIWAIAYRKIKFRSFRKNVDTAFLDKAIHWKPMMNQRAKDAADEEELEVALDDIDVKEDPAIMGSADAPPSKEAHSESSALDPRDAPENSLPQGTIPNPDAPIAKPAI